MKRAIFLLAFLTIFLVQQAFSFDWGGSVEDKSISNFTFDKFSSGYLIQTEIARLWMSQRLRRLG